MPDQEGHEEIEATLDAISVGRPVIWMETRGMLRDTGGRLVKPRANILQKRIEAVFLAARAKGKPCFIVGVKPRKRGFSTGVSALQYTELAKNAFHGVVVGNKLETSAEVFGIVRTFAENDGLRGKWGSPFKATTEKITWEHGARLTTSTAGNVDSIRGQTPQFLHGTEVAHWENEDGVFLALMNALPDDPSVTVVLESTPNGIAGAFATRWAEARWPTADECPGDKEYWRYWEALCPNSADSILAEWEFVRVFAAWFEFEESRIALDDDQKELIRQTLDARSWYAGERALIATYGNIGPNGQQRLGLEVKNTDVWEQLAWRRMTIKAKCDSDPRKFDQEHPRDPKTCFLSSGNPVFDADALAYYQASSAAIPREFGALQEGGNERAVWHAAPTDTAWVWRWEQPRVGCSYLLIVDPAEGEDQTKGANPDRHSALVLRAPYREPDGTLHRAKLVARISPPCFVPIYVLAEWVDLLSRYYGRCMVIPEMNNSGLAFITAARVLGMPIWKRKEFNTRTGEKEEKFGWRTTDTADYGGERTRLIDNLHAVLREQEIDMHCPHVVNELASFVRKGGRVEAESGAHDDDVMALAIGMYNLDAATVYAEQIVERAIPAELRHLYERNAPGNKMAMRW